jgi:hypothetical protein
LGALEYNKIHTTLSTEDYQSHPPNGTLTLPTFVITSPDDTPLDAVKFFEDIDDSEMTTDETSDSVDEVEGYQAFVVSDEEESDGESEDTGEDADLDQGDDRVSLEAVDTSNDVLTPAMIKKRHDASPLGMVSYPPISS